MIPVWVPDSQNHSPENPYRVKSKEELDGKNFESSLPPVSILVVDDSVDCRMILRMALEREGYRCLEAEDGIAALKLCQKKTIDFIITDFQMPHMDGCECGGELSSCCDGYRKSYRFCANESDPCRCIGRPLQAF